MQHVLTGAQFKLKRSVELCQELKASVEQFHNDGGRTIIETVENDPPESVFRVKQAELPNRWLLLLGDCIHNARSSLDFLVYTAAELRQRATGETFNPKSTFLPIADSAQAYVTRRGSLEALIQPAYLAIIDQAKPYRGGNDPLWNLHWLDIYDKHRLIIAASSAIVGNRSGLAMPYYDGAVFTANIGNIAKFPVEDGDIVFSVPQDNGGAQPEIRVDFDWLFGPSMPMEGQPVGESLVEMLRAAEKVLEAFWEQTNLDLRA
jgi:hypothetical protein